MAAPGISEILAYGLGAICIAMIVVGPTIVRKVVGGGTRHRSQDNIPAAEMYFVSSGNAMNTVRKVLTDQAFLNCKFRITYDRMDEGRIQARLYGKPKSDDPALVEPGSDPAMVDILLNMLFHRHEDKKTEVEWSYVVMSKDNAHSGIIVSQTNAAFRAALSAAQNS